mgnify:CR=1 FL=1
MSEVLIFGGGCCVGGGLVLALVIWAVIEAFLRHK